MMTTLLMTTVFLRACMMSAPDAACIHREIVQHLDVLDAHEHDVDIVIMSGDEITATNPTARAFTTVSTPLTSSTLESTSIRRCVEHFNKDDVNSVDFDRVIAHETCHCVLDQDWMTGFVHPYPNEILAREARADRCATWLTSDDLRSTEERRERKPPTEFRADGSSSASKSKDPASRPGLEHENAVSKNK